MKNKDKEEMKGAVKGQQVEQTAEMKKEIEAYLVGLSKLMHSKETSKKIIDMLKQAAPEKTIPPTALTINAQMEGAMNQKGKAPSLEVLMNSAVFIVSDLIEMGHAAGIFQIPDEEVGIILQETMQSYIEQGLKAGTIDPVELQEKVGPLMSEEHQAQGLEAAQLSGIPQEANQGTAMQSYGDKMQRRGMMKGAKGMEKKAAQAPPQAAQGGA